MPFHCWRYIYWKFPSHSNAHCRFYNFVFSCGSVHDSKCVSTLQRRSLVIMKTIDKHTWWKDTQLNRNQRVGINKRTQHDFATCCRRYQMIEGGPRFVFSLFVPFFCLLLNDLNKCKSQNICLNSWYIEHQNDVVFIKQKPLIIKKCINSKVA